MAMEEEAQLPGASARGGSRAILNALSDLVAGFEANPGDPAAFLTQMVGQGRTLDPPPPSFASLREPLALSLLPSVLTACAWPAPQREVLRGAQEDMATLVADARMLEIAQRIMGVSCEVSGGDPDEVAADLRYLAVSHTPRAGTEPGPIDGALQHLPRLSPGGLDGREISLLLYSDEFLRCH